MWAYLAAYEMPHDDPRARSPRACTIDYPIAVDRVLGLGVTADACACSSAFARPRRTINRFERVLVWCHWMWFAVPHGSVAYVLCARPGAVSRRGGADVRRVRPRRGVLLGDPDRAALVRGRAHGRLEDAPHARACAG